MIKLPQRFSFRLVFNFYFFSVYPWDQLERLDCYFSGIFLSQSKKRWIGGRELKGKDTWKATGREGTGGGIEKGGTREGCRKGDRWKGWRDKWKDVEKRVTGARM